jgi:hypothetical protein
MQQDAGFKERMFSELNIKQTDLDKVHGSIKAYRDKFVAHLDSEGTMNIPRLDEGLRMVCFYYSEVEKICEDMSGLPGSLESFYDKNYKDGRAQYKAQA